MRVAITGGTGFVGRHLAEQLNSAETVILSRRTGHDIMDVQSLIAMFESVDVSCPVIGGWYS